MDYGDYYWDYIRDYYRDPFLHSLLSTRQFRDLRALQRERLLDLAGAVW